MRLCFLLLVCVIAVSAWPIEDLSLRVSGANGWYVPQKDGALRWVSRGEGERQLAHYEAQEAIMGRLSTNTVNFYLHTLRNINAGQQIKATRASIDASNFNPKNPTRITIHGWNSNYKDGVNTKIAAAWFLTGDYNMIAVDWVRGRSLEYASSVAAAPGAGKKIAALVDFLVQEYGMSLDTLEVVGFSLGAHVAGHTAKQVASGEVGKVVGLDPAMPLISYSNTAKRLASDDARYVESIHTAGGTMGFTKPIGKAAFFVNGGRSQPGCGIDIAGSCAHTRAVTYYVESLRWNNFPTKRCDTHEDAHKNACGDRYSSVLMGATVNIFVADGIFYVPVNKQSPFGLGELLDDSTTVAPITRTTAAKDSTTADGEDDSTTASPEEDSSTAAPEEGSTTPAPRGDDDSTTAAPEEGEDDSTTAAPEEGGDDSTTAAPEDDSTTAAPEEGGDDSSTAAPEDGEDDSTTAAPEDGEDDSTTAAPEDDSTTEASEDESTTDGPEEDSTTAAPEEGEDDSTTAAPEDGEDDSTTASSEDDSTTADPEDGEDDSTTAAPEEDSTTDAPEEDSTTAAPEDGEDDSTTAAPEDEEGDSTTSTPEEGEDDSTTSAPEEGEDDSTTTAPEDDSTTAAPEEDPTTTTAEPEDPNNPITDAPEERPPTPDVPGDNDNSDGTKNIYIFNLFLINVKVNKN